MAPGPFIPEPAGRSCDRVLVLEAGQEDLGDHIGVELVGEAGALVLTHEVRSEVLGPYEQRMLFSLDGFDDRSGASSIR